jgi:LPXTG-motif cell wall-anchored protein
MKISRWAAVAVGLAAGGLALAGPASAHHNEVAVDITTDGCQLTATSAWAGDQHLVGNAVVVVRHDGEVHTAEVGDQLDVELAPGTTAVEWRTWGGGERDYDSPALADLDALLEHLDGGGDVLDGDAPGVAWHTLAVEGCEPEPTPTPTADPTPDPTVEPTVEPSTEPGETPAPGVGGEQLPTTGVPAAGLAVAGGAVVAAGGGALWLARRRRVSFTA